MDLNNFPSRNGAHIYSAVIDFWKDFVFLISLVKMIDALTKETSTFFYGGGS